MKLGFDAKRYFNNVTGLGNYSRWLVHGLSEDADLDIHLYHPREVETLTPAEQVHGPKGIWKTLGSFWRFSGICKDLENNKIEVYHGLSNEIPFGIHKTSVRSVVTIHDLIQKRYPENYKYIDRQIYNFKVNYAQKHADRIICPSIQTANDLVKYFGTNRSKISIIPLSISKREIAYSPPPIQDEYMLCVSSFERRKNLINLIKAFQNADIKNHHLVIAGRIGDTYQRVQRMSQDDPRIHIVPDPSIEELHQFYDHASFVIYPSRYEGFGIPVLEAYQHNKAIALSTAGSLKEVAGDVAEYFNPEDRLELQQALENLSNSEKLRKHLESLAGGQLNKFKSEDLIQKYKKVYQELL